MAGIGTRFQADFTEIEVTATRDGELGQEVQIRYVHLVPHVESGEWYPVQWLVETGWVERMKKP
jgi:hypothetical protein